MSSWFTSIGMTSISLPPSTSVPKTAPQSESHPRRSSPKAPPSPAPPENEETAESPDTPPAEPAPPPNPRSPAKRSIWRPVARGLCPVAFPCGNLSSPAAFPKWHSPHSKTLPNHKNSRYLAVLFLRVGILIIEGKREKRPLTRAAFSVPCS
jgi:hypothetical protein